MKTIVNFVFSGYTGDMALKSIALLGASASAHVVAAVSLGWVPGPGASPVASASEDMALEMATWLDFGATEAPVEMAEPTLAPTPAKVVVRSVRASARATRTPLRVAREVPPEVLSTVDEPTGAMVRPASAESPAGVSIPVPSSPVPSSQAPVPVEIPEVVVTEGMGGWMSSVHHLLSGRAVRRYPAAARRAGLEGRVVVAIEVSSGGRVKAVRLHNSSGYPALDAAALSALSRVRRIPSPPAAFARSGRPLLMPVDYKLL